jgi:hypothetical protein
MINEINQNVMICVINNVGFPMKGDFKYEINFRFGVRVSGYTVM